MKVTSIVSILNLVILFSVNSQDIKFKHLSSKDGLLSKSVISIIQDSDGFMWFGTKDGLCRYDGYSFLNFTYSPTDSQTLSNNYIACLAEDHNQNIWIGTHNGLNMLNRETYKIERFTSFFNDSTDIGSVKSLLVSDSNKLWIGSEYTGLYAMDLNTFQITNYKHDITNQTSIINNTVNCILEDKQRRLLIGTQNGLDTFDQTTSTFNHLLPDSDIRCLKLYQDSSVFIGMATDQNIYYNLSADSIIKPVALPELFLDKEVLCHIDSEDNEWISIRQKGLFYNDHTKKSKHKLSFDKYNPDGISSNSITSFCEDKFGNIWIGTFESGINIYKKNSNSFIHIKDNYLPNGLQNNRVRSIYQDSEGDIWIGTKEGGTLSQFNRQTLAFTHYKHNPSDPYSLSNDFIFSITEDRPGYLWVGTSHGLNLFEKKTGKIKSFFHNPEDPNGINSNNIYVLLKDEKDLFIGTVTEGLNILDTEQNTVRHFKHNDKSNSISSNKVRVLYKDSRDNIWIGSINGLNLFDRETGTFTRFINDLEDPHSISENDIKCIYEDDKQNLWVGTILGVNLMDKKNNTFKVFTTEDGLSGNYINGIQGDNHGNLWISTNNGLSCFNPETGIFRNYNIFDGLQDNEFSPQAHYKTQNGEMIFGGNNGFNIFHPDNISVNLTPPDIMLTDFRLFNQHLPVNTPNSPLKKHISRSSEVILQHKQSVLTIDYVAINYTSPEKNQYAYKMEGFENQWNYVGNKREATYTNLDPGTYVFRVKASNNDGVWNKKGTSLTIKVLPPPWLTWWAYSFYIVLILCISLLIRYYSIKRIHEEKGRELDQQNLKFFINVSHEFRTPLTLILNPIKKILSANNLDDSKKAAQDISISANKLMSLINQLLDFRKSDLGLSPLNVVETDIVKYSNEIFNIFRGAQESNKMKFVFHSSHSVINTWFDPSKFEKILNNLLSNAIKYTPNEGTVSLSISKTHIFEKKSSLLFFNKRRQKEYVEIKVQDTGIGLNQNQKQRVFDRFYSSDDTKTGTGIGLNYSKSLVELHKGNITVESQEDEGTTFIVQLPLGKVHFTNAQLRKDEFSLIDYNFDVNHLESLEYDIEITDNTVETNNTDEQKTIEIDKGNLPIVLLVEDNKKLRKQLYEELKHDYIIIEAINGQDGWEKTEKHSPNLIISDIMMPIMDGVELCDKIKSNLNTCHIPIILLTAKNVISNKIDGFKTGADDYITKPFVMEVLTVRIQNLLQSRKRLKEKYLSSSYFIPAQEITTNNLDEEFLEKITNIVLKNISNMKFSREDLGNELNMNRTMLYQKINSLTGTSPSALIRTIKLKYAAKLILQNKYRINEICYMSGFNYPAHFNKIFRDTFDETPLEYQKNNTPT